MVISDDNGNINNVSSNIIHGRYWSCSSMSLLLRLVEPDEISRVCHLISANSLVHHAKVYKCVHDQVTELIMEGSPKRPYTMQITSHRHKIEKHCDPSLEKDQLLLTAMAHRIW